MKILITTDPEIAVPPVYYGGAERMAYNLAVGLKKKGHQVVLIASETSSRDFVDKFYPWPGKFSRGWRNNLKNSLQLLKVIKKENPDIIYCYSRIIYIYLSAFLTKKLFIKRYGRHISAEATGIANALLHDRIQYVALARHMLSHIGQKSEKWHIIPNSIDVDKFWDDRNVSKDSLMFLGRVEHIKGTKEAIEVALKTNNKLIIAGNVPDGHQAYFDEFVRPFLDHPLIEYVGPVNDEQKRILLQKSKALLFPINLAVEAFGIVMIESLACGTPVIGRNIAAVPEVIKDGVNGFLCDSIEAMCAAVRRLDEIDRETVREMTVRDYSVDSITEAHLKLFEKLNG